MPGDYDTHAIYMGWVEERAEVRKGTVEAALREAFSDFIDRMEVEVILFADISASALASAIIAQPLVLKPLLICCNIAARAIERDLGLKNLNTYSPRLTEHQAFLIAGYIKPFLPDFLEIPALVRIDRVSFIDKEIRKAKGRWERAILKALNKYSRSQFRKRSFSVGGETFELDAASPPEGEIEVGVDVKRIEARRDIHKRCDEIVNKANKLKSAFPKARFGAVLYYPFIAEHVNVQNRLKSPGIDATVFASGSDESVESAVRLLLSTLEGSRE